MKMQFLIKKKVKIMSNETILDMINQIGDGELNKAQDMFNSILQDKQSSALESQRISVAGQIFNGESSRCRNGDI